MTIKTLTIIALAVVPCAFAADATKPALPLKPTAAFELKSKSSFALPEGMRSPFRPIGWKGGGGTVQQVVTPKSATDGTAFRVSSILMGNPSLAVINGRSYEEGQMIRFPKSPTAKANERQIRAKLFRIGDGVVYIQVEDQLITVPLKRGELKELQPDGALNMERE
jgi:hypothetical protein